MTIVWATVKTTQVIDGPGFLLREYIRGFTTRGTPVSPMSIIKGPLIWLILTVAHMTFLGP